LTHFNATLRGALRIYQMMRRWRPWRVGVLVVAAMLVLIIAAKIHACACVGGPPEWRSVLLSIPPSGQG